MKFFVAACDLLRNWTRRLGRAVGQQGEQARG